MTNTEAASKRRYRNAFLRNLSMVLALGLTIYGTGAFVPGWLLVLLWVALAAMAIFAAVDLVNWRGWFGATSHES